MESEGAGMKEYIEREALLGLYQIDGPLNETGRVPLPVIRQNIMDMPAAEVAEVRHGRLEYAPYNGVYDAKCSNCGYSPGIKFWDSPYCPNCGALMLEDEHEAD